MAFGQQAGPPATHRQIDELRELLRAAGHVDFRDARGPMGFNQRQAGGRFTRDEADAYIAQLQADAELEATSDASAAATPASDRPARSGAPRSRPPSGRGRASQTGLGRYTDQQLAAELQARGWVVMEP